ncbi:hypothetical protein [Catenovulum adriaticum]|uniref:Peptidoglycan-binding protein CsiV n=1 Tax=Catenovulum adriaticum TaxID=2984846 RepID=A0ABY7AKT2_9ALTE|nr:hypothetical protein [Catenovulum sp. TS8]WAJ70160.1 hypothetical protein OLW01_13605 [Catenovulum sp. TS8]
MGKILSVILIWSFFVNQGLAQQALWASPTYPASEPKPFEVTIQTQYEYQLWVPKRTPQKLRLLQKKYASLTTPEEALVSRFSAISSLNYPWWLSTWQDSSKQLALNFYQKKGLDQNYWLDTWKKQFVGRSIKLKYKVKYQNYIIFTYNVSAPSGKESFLDVPIVFNQQQQQWLVSLDLRKSPLLRLSPWVSGLDTETVRYE